MFSFFRRKKRETQPPAEEPQEKQRKNPPESLFAVHHSDGSVKENVGAAQVLAIFAYGQISHDYKKGMELEAAGNLPQSLEHFEKAIEGTSKLIDSDPSNGEHYANRASYLSKIGRILQKLGRLEQAKPYYLKADEDFDRAFTYLKESSDLHFNYGLTLFDHGELMWKTGKEKEAMKQTQKAAHHFKQASIQNPGDAGVFIHLAKTQELQGDLYNHLKQPDKAALCYQESIETYQKTNAIIPAGTAQLAGPQGVLHYKMHQIHTEAKQPEKALEAIRRALPLLEVAVRKNPEEAIFQNYLQIAKRIHPQPVESEGSEENREKAYDEARESYMMFILGGKKLDEGMMAIPSSPEEPHMLPEAERSNGFQQSMKARTLFLEALQRFERADECVDKALSLCKDEPPFLIMKASNQMMLGKTHDILGRHAQAKEGLEKAETLCKRALSLGFVNAEVYSTLGDTYAFFASLLSRIDEKEESREKAQQALSSYDRAIQMGPGVAEYLEKRDTSRKILAQLDHH